MLRNYFITVIRNIKREKAFTFLNLSGLGLGIGCALVIFKIISYQLSYETHLSNYDNLYRVVRQTIISTGIRNNAGVPHPVGEALRNDFPDLKVGRTYFETGHQVAVKKENGDYNRFRNDDDGIVFTESVIFDLIDYTFVAGDAVSCLDEPGSVVLSRSMAKLFFNLSDENVQEAMGKELRIANRFNVLVKALVEDPPETTDLPFKIFTNYESIGEVSQHYRDGQRWNSNSSNTNCLVLLPNEETKESFEQKLVPFVDKYHGDGTSNQLKYLLQPISDLHYSTIYSNYTGVQIPMNIIISLGVIGIFLVITAAINFVNLATAQSVKRSKEVGIRKTMGGKTNELARQFLTETYLITIFSVFFGLIVAELLLIYLEDIIGTKLALNLLSEPVTLLFLAIVVLIIGALAGLYPSVMMSKLDPVDALRNTFNMKIGRGFLSFRRVLVIVQFAISQMLIIGTIVVSQQMDFFINEELGFDKDNIIELGIPERDENKMKRFKQALKGLSEVKNATFCMGPPLSLNNSNTNIGHHSIPENENVRVNIKFSDEDYFDVFGLELVSGELLDKPDTTQIIINSKLAKALGFDNPADAIGEDVRIWWAPSKVVGVSEDFHTDSFRDDYMYTIFLYQPFGFYNAAIKLNTAGMSVDQMEQSVRKVQKAWEEVYPEEIFDYQFLDEQIAERYDQERHMKSMFELFSVIAIFIGCLGLYGLISYVANKKTKEIGIRKVLGASTTNILQIFSREMLILVVISFLIAGPSGYFIMNKWLQDFAYKIDLSWVTFVIALAASFGIALVTIGYKAVAASIANPVNSLRDE